MKAFIVAALLVASVAGQSLDMYKSFNKDLQVSSRKGLMFGGLKNYPYGGGDYSNQVNYDGGDYYYGGDSMNVLQYEEIVSHPLFREYMTLPLFRQYWSYPMFQRYVCSHYFQQYWTMPTFQQYFTQPYLFYKYIYPIVQLFKYDATSTSTYNPYTTSGGDWIWNRNTYPMGDYYQGQGQQQFNYGGVPTVCFYNSMYCRNLVQKMYNHLMYTSKMIAPDATSSMDMDADYYKYNPYYARMMYPNMYNKQFYPTVYNKEFQNFEVPSKTLINEDVLRPIVTRDAIPMNKVILGEKTFEQKNIPEQMIKV